MKKKLVFINKNKYKLTIAIIAVMIVLSIGVYEYIYNSTIWNTEYKTKNMIKDFSSDNYVLTNISNDNLYSFNINNGNCFGITFLEKYNYLKRNKSTEELDKIINKLDSRKLLNYDKLHENLSSYKFSTISEFGLINSVNTKIEKSEEQDELSNKEKLEVFNQTLEEVKFDDSYISMLRDIYYIQEEYRNNPKEFIKDFSLSTDVNVDYLVSNITNNIPVIIGVIAKNSGHALLAYGYNFNDNILSVQCIDPNNPEITTEIKFKYKLLKWKYVKNNKYEQENGVIEYLWSDIQDLIKTIVFA